MYTVSWMDLDFPLPGRIFCMHSCMLVNVVVVIVVKCIASTLVCFLL